MKTAKQILENKGYDLNEINDIINFKTKYSEEGLDMKVRLEFKLDGEPLHLWEAYYQGDASREALENTAKEAGYVYPDTQEYKDANQDGEGNVGELLTAMDRRLNELCEEVEEKQVEEER